MLPPVIIRRRHSILGLCLVVVLFNDGKLRLTYQLGCGFHRLKHISLRSRSLLIIMFCFW